jgi:hypothetical protein
MKKNYVKPSVEVIKVNAVNMLATSSIQMMNNADPVDTTTEQLGRKNNSSFGNIWDSQW